MSRIIEAGDLPEQEKVFMRKGIFRYRVVHPIRNSDGKVNWLNLLVGGWGNFFMLIFILLILLSFFYGVKELLSNCKDMAENPCRYFGSLSCPKTISPLTNPLYGLVMIPNYSNIPHK